MNQPLRSRHGCWTCRLRKKKCDERQPHCTICESLSITCYGFGDKPEWMDGGEKERAVANGIKEIVKHTSRRKVMTQVGKQKGPIIKLAPKPSSTSVDDSSTNPTSLESDTTNDHSNNISTVGPLSLVLEIISSVTNY